MDTANALGAIDSIETEYDVMAREETYIEGYSTCPIPYDEDLVPEQRKLWVDDIHDYLVPKRKSFITDFVYHTRGIMTPTLACIWSSLFLLQTVVKREAWLEWYPKPLYPNQYIIIIGAAGRIKKTTAVSHVGLDILSRFRKYIRDRNIYEMKKLTIIKDKATPEAMLSAMLPEAKQTQGVYYMRKPDGSYLLDEDGRAIPYYPTSEASLIISELATMLSKRSYSDGIVEILLDLYDPHDTWEWRRESVGVKRLKKLCTSLIAGTTVDGFRSSIPHAAKGDGFLSRSVLVYVSECKRLYPQPFLPFGAPDAEEMAKRLAWISEHALGEYRLSEGASKLYYAWFYQYSNTLDNNPMLAGAMSRMDINVLKTALLLRIARYTDGEPVIDVQDMEDAIRLVETTYQSVPFLLGQLDEDMILTQVARAEVYLKQRGRVERSKFLTGLRIRSDIAAYVLTELVARNEITIEYQGKTYVNPLHKTGEIYVWKGKEDEAGESEACGTTQSNRVWEDSRNYAEQWFHKKCGTSARRESRNTHTILQKEQDTP